MITYALFVFLPSLCKLVMTKGIYSFSVIYS